MAGAVAVMVTSSKVPMQALLCTAVTPTRSRPLSTHDFAEDSWTLTGKSGSVTYGVTAPFSWVLVHTRFFFFFNPDETF